MNTIFLDHSLRNFCYFLGCLLVLVLQSPMSMAQTTPGDLPEVFQSWFTQQVNKNVLKPQDAASINAAKSAYESANPAVNWNTDQCQIWLMPADIYDYRDGEFKNDVVARLQAKNISFVNFRQFGFRTIDDKNKDLQKLEMATSVEEFLFISKQIIETFYAMGASKVTFSFRKTTRKSDVLVEGEKALEAWVKQTEGRIVITRMSSKNADEDQYPERKNIDDSEPYVKVVGQGDSESYERFSKSYTYDEIRITCKNSDQLDKQLLPPDENDDQSDLQNQIAEHRKKVLGELDAQLEKYSKTQEEQFDKLKEQALQSSDLYLTEQETAILNDFESKLKLEESKITKFYEEQRTKIKQFQNPELVISEDRRDRLKKYIDELKKQRDAELKRNAEANLLDPRKLKSRNKNKREKLHKEVPPQKRKDPRVPQVRPPREHEAKEPKERKDKAPRNINEPPEQKRKEPIDVNLDIKKRPKESRSNSSRNSHKGPRDRDDDSRLIHEPPPQLRKEPRVRAPNEHHGKEPHNRDRDNRHRTPKIKLIKEPPAQLRKSPRNAKNDPKDNTTDPNQSRPGLEVVTPNAADPNVDTSTELQVRSKLSFDLEAEVDPWQKNPEPPKGVDGDVKNIHLKKSKKSKDFDPTLSGFNSEEERKEEVRIKKFKEEQKRKDFEQREKQIKEIEADLEETSYYIEAPCEQEDEDDKDHAKKLQKRKQGNGRLPKTHRKKRPKGIVCPKF